MFRCTWRWLGVVNYSPRDKQRPMMKKVFLEKNLFMALAIFVILYRISRKYLDMYICFLSSFFFFISFSDKIIHLPLSLCSPSLSLTIVLLRYSMCKVEEFFYFIYFLFNLRIIIPKNIPFLLSSSIFFLLEFFFYFICTNDILLTNRYITCLQTKLFIHAYHKLAKTKLAFQI